MSATGFKDWNAEEAEVSRAGSGRRRALLVDDDFSWSEPPPARARRVAVAETPVRRRRPAAEPVELAEPAPGPVAERELNLERELDQAWGGSLTAAEVASWDESTLLPVPDGRRTVVITGHGAERQVPMGRRQRGSDLRIHERAGFSPDRIGMWAFLLGVALVLGAIIH